MERTYLISTKEDEDSVAVVTSVTVDFNGFTLDTAVERFFTSTSPRVALQAKLRKAKGGIPKVWRCKAVEFGTGRTEMVRPMTLDELKEGITSKNFTPEQLEAMQGMIKQALGL